MRGFSLLLAAGPVALHAAEQRQTMKVAANPIRKVVTMMQALQAKVEAEGAIEKELFDKYMCYCKNGASALAESIAAAEAKGPELAAAIEAGTGKLAQLKDDIKAHQADRAAAKTAMAEATALREKEAAAFAQATGDLKTNLAGLAKAIAAIEKGAGGFLQTTAASMLKKLVMNKNNMLDADRQDVLSFLSSDSEYAPASGEITGILKTMADEMAADLKAATDDETAAITAFDGLMAAKKKEVDSLTAMIEDKLQRVGDLGVEIQEMKNDLGDSADSLVDDKKFLADLDKNCESKQKLYDENIKMRGQELAALADTIKVLNDDDALELFKKTLPGRASFIQVTVTTKDLLVRAASAIRESRKHKHDYRTDAILLALQGKSVDFSKVIGMIDSMVALLKKEQVDDDAMLQQCRTDLDLAEDKKKELDRSMSLLEKHIEEDETSIATLTEEITALVEGVEALDKEVAERTDVRKEENSDFITALGQHRSALDLLSFAKNRMNKFYNPKLYTAPPKRELSEDERLTVNFGGSLAPTAAPGGIAGTGISLVATNKAAPPPPPETWGAYNKKSEESNGVISMMDLLLKDLSTEMTEMEVTEKQDQVEYEEFMTDAAEKRIADSKSITDKNSAKADTQAHLEDDKSNRKSTVASLMLNDKTVMRLHQSCDWLMKFYEIRQEARNGEVASLKTAKAVLSGATYS